MASSLSSRKMATTQNGKTPLTAPHISSASKLLEKKSTNMHHIGRSTPDSEALASSDDDHDQNAMSQSAHSNQSAHSATAPRTTRRASWLSEVHAGSQQRKFSLGSTSNAQPSSGPTTPSGEGGPTGWSLGSGGIRPSLWSTTWQKDPPTRPPGDATTEGITGRYLVDDDALVSPTSYQYPSEGNEGSFPFPIPMQPVRKTYRSQSYSVGQTEAETNAPGTSAGATPSTAAFYSRVGASGYSHRPSRPSMLGDSVSGGVGGVGGVRPVLGQLLEDEDDYSHSPVNYSPANLQRSNFGKIDQSSGISNQSSALLKQAALENARAKQRLSSNAGLSGPELFARPSMGQRPTAAMAPESALEDMKEDTGFADHKKAQWQTSLGFGPVDDGSQSRRHSFADVPGKPRIMSSSLLSPRGQEGFSPLVSTQPDTAVVDDRKFAAFRKRFKPHIPSPLSRPPMQASQARDHASAQFPQSPSQTLQSTCQLSQATGLVPAQTFRERSETARVMEDQLEQEHLNNRMFAALYFHGIVPSLRSQQEATTDIQANAATLRDTPRRGPDASPLTSINPFAVPSVITNPQPDLYVVTFQCARADVYYIPANTGLQVKVGDMVVVEGDRGIDLGTVSHARVSLAEAKQLKEAATDQHFNWLMMFSRTMQSVTGTTTSSGLLAATNGDRPSAVGGMGPRVPLPANSQSPHADHDIRPKMIRRLAQNHEIQMLRDKEGAEAKAKRVCQSKVSDHGLNMEILDAEFQFDWKKLTYFYYAESYVNFNELVTDLFKVYKTRIWMSAINPASFASPSGGFASAGQFMLGAPSSSLSPVAPRDPVGPHRPTSREPVVHGEEAAQRYMSYPLYGQMQAPAAMPYGSAWVPPPAPPLMAPNITYGSPNTTSPYPTFPDLPPGPLANYLNWRPPQAAPQSTGGQSYDSNTTISPENMADQLRQLSLGSQQH